MAPENEPRASGSAAPSVDEELARWERERGIASDERSAVYVSTPITTGRAFVEWYRREGHRLERGTPDYERAHRSEVVLPNTQRAARYIEVLRWRHVGLIIDPSSFEVPGWSECQERYHAFWLRVLERHARRVVFMDGWQYSTGCTIEYEAAARLGLDCVDESLERIPRSKGTEMLEVAIRELEALGCETVALRRAREGLRRIEVVVHEPGLLFKDEVLDSLAHTANVAQFASFAPELEPRYSRIRGFEPNHTFDSPRAAVEAILERSPESRVNVRSYHPQKPEGNPFRYGLDNVEDVLASLRELGPGKGLFTIVNETIDESDGGVSGVSYRNVLEFAPDTTPRCVDDPEIDTLALSFELGMVLLRSVYGFEPDLRGREGARVEFSIHPRPRGWQDEHTIVWQFEQRPNSDLDVQPRWPNDFSRMLGDKAFGLLLARAAGLDVPRSLVVSKRLFPFDFGRPTGTGRVWTRTCPAEKEPGFYPTVRGWVDPHAVLADPWILAPEERCSADDRAPVNSVVVQEAVDAVFSGRAKRVAEGLVIAGVSGEGDDFMVGGAREAELPSGVRDAVRAVHARASDAVGEVELEWVYDGSIVWVVQMNAARPIARFASPEAEVSYERFVYESKDQIEEFRRLAKRLAGSGRGVLVVGEASPLSHLGEIADKYGVPARFENRPPPERE